MTSIHGCDSFAEEILKNVYELIVLKPHSDVWCNKISSITKLCNDRLSIMVKIKEYMDKTKFYCNMHSIEDDMIKQLIDKNNIFS